MVLIPGRAENFQWEIFGLCCLALSRIYGGATLSEVG